MRPESTSITFNPILAQLLHEYDIEKAAAKFIGRKVAPIFRSPSSTGEYPIMNRENFKKRTPDDRAPDGSYNRITGEFGKGSFATDEHALEGRVDRRMRQRYSSLFDAKAVRASQVWFQALLNHEYRVHALLDGGGFTNTNVTTAWSTVASAVPLNDIDTGIEALEDNCGCNPEDISLVIPRADFRELNRVTQIVDKVKYTYPGEQPSKLSAQQIAAMLGIKEVIVARSSHDTKEEGVTESMSQIWTAGVMYLMVLAEEGDDLSEPSAARTIIWDQYESGLPGAYDYPEESTNADIVRAGMDSDEVLVGETDLFVYKLTNT